MAPNFDEGDVIAIDVQFDRDLVGRWHQHGNRLALLDETAPLAVRGQILHEPVDWRGQLLLALAGQIASQLGDRAFRGRNLTGSRVPFCPGALDLDRFRAGDPHPGAALGAQLGLGGADVCLLGRHVGDRNVVFLACLL